MCVCVCVYTEHGFIGLCRNLNKIKPSSLEKYILIFSISQSPPASYCGSCIIEVAAEKRPGEQLENWLNRVHQFFTLTFFPAYELNLVWTKEMQEEQQRQNTEKKMTLEKAKANAKYFTF